MTHPDAILEVFRLGSPPWPTEDPFLFCVHHKDAYPVGNPDMTIPKATLEGRRIGMDFSGKDGFSMYHGSRIPGFPSHPHRGFETVTLARHGFIDHSDSLGARARFGAGDVQWMTAGRGIVHSEMFPLLRSDGDNPAELFQLWLNLPREDKMVDPYFRMLWSEQIPVVRVPSHTAEPVEVTVLAGSLDGKSPPTPPPNSWASRPDAAIAIWLITLPTGSEWTCPGAAPRCRRTLYFYQGDHLTLAGTPVRKQHGITLRADTPVTLRNDDAPAELLLLQGRPIGEPVVQHGPFVMNEPQEVAQAIADYQQTGFGGWPWPEQDPIHQKDSGRFAEHANGKQDRPGNPGSDR